MTMPHPPPSAEAIGSRPRGAPPAPDHPITLPAATRAAGSGQTAPPALTRNYVSVPRKLVRELRDNPLAIGIYALLGRLFLIEQRPVPLSRGDLRLIDPTLRIGAITRALARLRTSGWLLEQPGLRKGHYQPTWGQGRARPPIPWQIGPRLGCPTHLAPDLIRIDRRLIDVFLGRFRPHVHNATIERYVTVPLLSLTDVGHYIRATVIADAAPVPPALRRWGLLDATNTPHAIPDTTAVLALASQWAGQGASQLTEAGWRQLGCGSPADHAESAPASVPLFFVPREWIGRLIPTVIGDVIGHTSPPPAPTSAAARAESPTSQDLPIMPGSQRDSNDSRNPPPPQPGGGHAAVQHRLPAASPTALALQALGAHPTCVAELADQPLALVTQARAYAEATPGIVNKAGWVVDALRRHRASGWAIPAPPMPAGHVDWGALRRAQAAEQAAVAPAAPLGSGLILADPADPHPLPAPTDLTAQVRVLLREVLPRADRVLADQLSVALEDATLRVTAALAQLVPVRDRVAPVLPAVLAALALPGDTRVVVQAGQPLPLDACPAWVDGGQWAWLPPRLRAALWGTVCVAGRVRGVTPAHTEHLHTLAAQLAVCGIVGPPTAS